VANRRSAFGKDDKYLNFPHQPGRHCPRRSAPVRPSLSGGSSSTPEGRRPARRSPPSPASLIIPVGGGRSHRVRVSSARVRRGRRDAEPLNLSERASTGRSTCTPWPRDSARHGPTSRSGVIGRVRQGRRRLAATKLHPNATSSGVTRRPLRTFKPKPTPDLYTTVPVPIMEEGGAQRSSTGAACARGWCQCHSWWQPHGVVPSCIWIWTRRRGGLPSPSRRGGCVRLCPLRCVACRPRGQGTQGCLPSLPTSDSRWSYS